MGQKLLILSGGLLFLIGQSTYAQKAKKDTASTREIEEVVVVGFGQKRTVKELTGSVGTVSGKAIQSNSSAASLDKALSGRVAGVVTGSASGQPGGAARIRVRGVTSVNGNSDPIIIIDGVRVSQGDLTNNSSTANILANLNSSDYESVTILKDAVSTAVYGADAGAGVVIITTKGGRKGKTRMSVSSEQGVAFRAIEGPRALNTSEWQGLLASAISNYRSISPSEAVQLAKTGKLGSDFSSIFNSTVNSDWRGATQKEGGAFFQNMNASMSGGTDKLTYYSSLGYFDQNSIVRNSFFKRITSTNKVDFKASDKMKITTNLQLAYSNMNTLDNGGAYNNPMRYLFNRPTDPIYNADGSYYLGDPKTGKLSNDLYNVAALQSLNYSNAKTARVFANLQAEYKILPNLVYRFVFAPEYINIEENTYDSPLHGDGTPLGGLMKAYNTRYFNFNVQNILSYDTRLGESHYFNASLIQEAYKSDLRRLFAEKIRVGAPFLQTLDSFVITSSSGGNKRVASRSGYAVMLHYDYDKIFLLDLSGRRDAMSNLWPGKKNGNFWSAGAGVDLARLEPFTSSSVLSQLKISLSYGHVGNNLQSYQIPYATYRYDKNYNGDAAVRVINVDNPNLTWEKVNPFNVGIDVGLLKNRITFSAAYFHKKTTDLVYNLPLSRAQGSRSKLTNVGDMVNKGFEFSVVADILKNRNGLNWRLGFNASTLNNKITKLLDHSDVITSFMILREGEAVNTFYIPKWAGVDPSNGNPLWYVNGKNGETTSNYNEATKAPQGTTTPTFFGGVDTSLSYKGFSLDAQLSYGFGNKIYDDRGNYLFSDGQYTQNYPGYAAQLDYWTPTHPHALNPKPILGGNTGTGSVPANQISTRFLYQGDYLRLRTLKLAYNFKGKTIRNTGLSNLEIYLLGNNIWTWMRDKNLQYDPDLQLMRSSNLNLPPMKTFSLGVNLYF
ncbi:SusC/RagA family TonB-linked outer membrane protein [Elizabethkingia argentiflava]|uniref:SusC/RagA family TonB-linked outer membrane protein n=1 Tax=Elizabethkingia argenteiflava TaxID=2681556 RepID=A0A845PWT0_9FLAO|nr:SusC/RagA family TonB-linked outer membrane protein [Elizabethkingia argenteiflava]NAW52304.1 SusC/RagA family TonB-linked outer membrane protein [Elizabethkingia argenteiflava]